MSAAIEPKKADHELIMVGADGKIADANVAAESFFRRAIELKPSLDRAWFGIGLTHAARGEHQEAIPAFGRIFESLGRTTSYESALNVYVCSLSIAIGENSKGINPAGNNGPWRQVCR